MYFGAGVEGKPAGSQSNKVVRGCFAGCKFGPRGLSLSHPLSTPFSSIVRCASRPLTLLESVHELPGHTKILHLDVFPPPNVVYPSTSLLSFFFFFFFSISDPKGRKRFFSLLSNRWTNRKENRLSTLSFHVFFLFVLSDGIIDRRNFFLNFLKFSWIGKKSFHFKEEVSGDLKKFSLEEEKV